MGLGPSHPWAKAAGHTRRRAFRSGPWFPFSRSFSSPLFRLFSDGNFNVRKTIRRGSRWGSWEGLAGDPDSGSTGPVTTARGDADPSGGLSSGKQIF